MRRNLIPLIATFLLTACDPHGYKAAEKAIGANLKDPYTAKYTDQKPCPSGTGVTINVNSRNEYGAYTGNKSYIVVNRQASLGDDGPIDQYLFKTCYGKTEDEFLNDVGKNLEDTTNATQAAAPSGADALDAAGRNL